MGVRRGIFSYIIFQRRPLTRHSGEAAGTALATGTALIEFQSPTTSFLARPFPASGRVTIWIIAAGVGTAITAMSLCPVDCVVTAPGKLVAQTPNIVVQPLEASIVRAINVKEGQIVHAGELLARLDPAFAAAEATASVERTLPAAHASSMAARSDLEALMSERDSAVEQYRRETLQQLTEQGRRLSDAREQRSKSALRRSLVDLRADRDAVVLSVARVSVGSVLQSGDELITMVPVDAPLAIEASIAGRDAGFVQSGNPAILKFDTFPYASYGYGRGVVSADSFTNPQYAREHTSRPNASRAEAAKEGTFYRASVSMDELKLHHLPRGFRMAPGMPVTVDIKVGQRTVLAYLLSKVVPTLSEGMREP